MLRALCLGLILMPAALQARPAECLMVVDGSEIMRGACDFAPSGGDGSFQVTSSDLRYFAYVTLSAPGIAEGWWNAAPKAGHAHTPLGTLTRNGACWINPRAIVCAW